MCPKNLTVLGMYTCFSALTSGLSSLALHHSCAYFSQAIFKAVFMLSEVRIFFKNHSIVDSPTSLVALLVKNLPAVQETRVQFLGWEDPLEEEMATHFSVLAWKIPWAEEPGRLQPMVSQELNTAERLNYHHVDSQGYVSFRCITWRFSVFVDYTSL